MKNIKKQWIQKINNYEIEKFRFMYVVYRIT